MIYKYPDKILLTPSVDVTLEEGQEINKLLRENITELKWGEVVGLAAPQIGLNKNVFIALDKTYLNPKIIWYNPETEIKEEGCYSLKENKFDYKVKRSKGIRMSYETLSGKKKEGVFMGFQAQVMQHEYDHLLGKLCC